ncbi:hypothetical protein FA13DRAFT_925526 [Coprinellus micaceus]|uniref:Uncharacterized protein n=1 Tax=Coprinellus micaceus TaxID=71717 RepID=A0A4Y7TTY4_COPMI|nr:hypothetical protein FA13DRAFT_925526 [Coprinellus micaceus]
MESKVLPRMLAANAGKPMTNGGPESDPIACSPGGVDSRCDASGRKGGGATEQATSFQLGANGRDARGRPYGELGLLAFERTRWIWVSVR